MGGYVVLTWPPGDGGALDLLSAAGSSVQAEGWRWAIKEDGLWALTTARQPPAIFRARGGGLLIGELFSRRFVPATRADLHYACDPHHTPAQVCRTLLADFWGRYVAVLPQGGAAGPAIFRDPSGALECLTWRIDGVTVVASQLPDWLIRHLSPELMLDWSRIGDFLTNPANIGGAPALQGLQDVPAGALHQGGAFELLWRPADFARRHAPAPTQAREGLRAVVDGCVAALALARGPILAEVSGGFDSAVVAASLARSAHDQIGQWVNYYAADRRGDERRYARALARHCGFALTEAVKPEAALDAAAFDILARGPRPALDSLDAPRDQDAALRCKALDARAIFTGQGGDMVFFQRATGLVLADDLRRRGPRALTPTALRDLALWTGQSAWSVLHGAIAGRRPTSPAVDHPWLADLAGLPPAKRLQIEALAECQLMSGDSLRARQADLIHPLLTQPVMEHCLAIPTMDLTQGRRDRALARQAFADRLPRCITDRQAKGELSAYYGRMVAASLDVLRPLLLEGRLAARGLIDRDQMEDMLTQDSLIWRADYATILVAALVEAWASSWERRIAAGLKGP